MTLSPARQLNRLPMHVSAPAESVARLLLAITSALALSLASAKADPKHDLRSFLAGEVATWNSTGHPKAAGIEMKISYPKNWTAKEGNRPHIVQKFFGVFDRGMEQFMVQVRELPEPMRDPNKEERQMLFDAFAEEMSHGGNLVSRAVTKIDGEDCDMLETTNVTERAGMKVGQKVLTFVIPRKGAVLILQGSVGGDATAGFDKIEERYQAAKPLLQLIASSCVLTDKWLPKSD